MIGDGNRLVEEYIGVAFLEGPPAPEAGKNYQWCSRCCLFQPMYGKPNPGVSFTVREGPRIVGYGIVRRWLD
jgi:hypothetical protein